MQIAAPATVAKGERLFRIIPGQSTASYQAQEKWLRWHVPTKAVAKTDDVDGELVLVMGDQPRLAANHARVDMRTLVSEVADTPLSLGGLMPVGLFLSGRDAAVRTRLEVNSHPFAEFTATSIEGVPARYVEGQAVKVRVPGSLTIRGSTRPVTFDTEAMLQGNTLSGSATADPHD